MDKNKNAKAKSQKLKFSKLLLTSHFSLPTSQKGMTLVELMVSLVILCMVLGAIYSILTLQQTKATQVSRTTVLQTDAQVAFTLVKWDLMMAGFGYPYDLTDAVQLVSAGAGVGLKAVGLGFEMNRTRWSYMLKDPGGPIIAVRKWSDSLANLRADDTILILGHDRKPLYQDMIISKVDTFTHVDSATGLPMPGLLLTVGIPVSAPYGSMVLRRAQAIYSAGLTYSLVDDTLKRGTEPLLNNVEAIQFRYGIDNDGDGIVETWGNTNNPPFNKEYLRKSAIRFTMVVTSEGLPGYTYPSDSVTIEDNPPYSYYLTDTQKRRKRVILGSVVYPQNLQP